jgi:broad specificity phosphatase PhoE
MNKIFLCFLTIIVSLNCNGIENGIKNITTIRDKPIVIYFIRHGKTIFNKMNRVQGWADSPLTPEGEKVAEDLGRGLKDTLFVSAYTGDAGRHRETAGIVLKLNNNKNTPLYETKDLREWYFGSFEGDLSKIMYGAMLNAVGVKNGDNPAQIIKDLSIPQMANGIALADPQKEAEDWQAIETRIKRALETITKEVSAKGGGNVLIVTSGLTISSILYIIDPSQKRLGVDNASVSKVIFKDGKYTVESFGDLKFVEQGNIIR